MNYFDPVYKTKDIVFSIYSSRNCHVKYNFSSDKFEIANNEKVLDIDTCRLSAFGFSPRCYEFNDSTCNYIIHYIEAYESKYNVKRLSVRSYYNE